MADTILALHSEQKLKIRMSDDEGGDYVDEGGYDVEYISEDDIENPYYVENDSDSDSDPEPLTPSTLCRLVS